MAAYERLCRELERLQNQVIPSLQTQIKALYKRTANSTCSGSSDGHMEITCEPGNCKCTYVGYGDYTEETGKKHVTIEFFVETLMAVLERIEQNLESVVDDKIANGVRDTIEEQCLDIIESKVREMVDGIVEAKVNEAVNTLYNDTIYPKLDLLERSKVDWADHNAMDSQFTRETLYLLEALRETHPEKDYAFPAGESN